MSSNELQPNCELRIDQSALDRLAAPTRPSRAHGPSRDASVCGSTACLSSALTLQIVLDSSSSLRPNILPSLWILTNNRLRSLSPAGTCPNGSWRTHGKEDDGEGPGVGRAWVVVVVRVSGSDEFRCGVDLGAAARAGERGVVDELGEAEVGELDEHG